MPKCHFPYSSNPCRSMKSFSCCEDGWCSLQASLSSNTTFPASMNCLACSKACLLSFTAMIPLLKSFRMCALFPPVCGEHDALHEDALAERHGDGFGSSARRGPMGDRPD